MEKFQLYSFPSALTFSLTHKRKILIFLHEGLRKNTIMFHHCVRSITVQTQLHTKYIFVQQYCCRNTTADRILLFNKMYCYSCSNVAKKYCYRNCTVEFLKNYKYNVAQKIERTKIRNISFKISQPFTTDPVLVERSENLRHQFFRFLAKIW